jgi:hypothetical protein
VYFWNQKQFWNLSYLTSLKFVRCSHTNHCLGYDDNTINLQLYPWFQMEIVYFRVMIKIYSRRADAMRWRLSLLCCLSLSHWTYNPRCMICSTDGGIKNWIYRDVSGYVNMNKEDSIKLIDLVGEHFIL